MKRHDFLRELSSQHHQALCLARDILRGSEENEDLVALRSKARALYRDELSAHFDIEERTVLPFLVQAGKKSMVQQTLEEHRQLRQLVSKLDDTDSLLQFAQLLKAHVRFEERVLFKHWQMQAQMDERTA